MSDRIKRFNEMVNTSISDSIEIIEKDMSKLLIDRLSNLGEIRSLLESIKTSNITEFEYRMGVIFVNVDNSLFSLGELLDLVDDDDDDGLALIYENEYRILDYIESLFIDYDILNLYTEDIIDYINNEIKK